MGDLEIGQLEARIRFVTGSHIPLWAGNAFRSGLGARLRDQVCAIHVERGSLPAAVYDCDTCPLARHCQYAILFSSSAGFEKGAFTELDEVPRPLALTPPAAGTYRPGEGAVLGFVLLGQALDSLPYLMLALRDLGRAGLGRGYRIGAGRFDLELADSVSPRWREPTYYGGKMQSRMRSFSYSDLLQQADEWNGSVSVIFVSPAQIKEGGQYTSRPSFRTLLSRLLFRANTLASLYGTGELYDHKESLRILGEARRVSLDSASVKEIRQNRYFHTQGRSAWLPPFFIGELAYRGLFSREAVALLSLGEVIHVGKMATFGNGIYRMERRS